MRKRRASQDDKLFLGLGSRTKDRRENCGPRLRCTPPRPATRAIRGSASGVASHRSENGWIRVLQFPGGHQLLRPGNLFRAHFLLDVGDASVVAGKGKPHIGLHVVL